MFVLLFENTFLKKAIKIEKIVLHKSKTLKVVAACTKGAAKSVRNSYTCTVFFPSKIFLSLPSHCQWVNEPLGPSKVPDQRPWGIQFCTPGPYPGPTSNGTFRTYGIWLFIILGFGRKKKHKLSFSARLKGTDVCPIGEVLHKCIIAC